MRQTTPMGAAMEALLAEWPAGMQDLAAQLTARGFGHLVESWRGGGPLRPITPLNLLKLLGWRRVQALAAVAGLSPGDFLVRLARLLPAAMRRALACPDKARAVG